MEGLALKHSTFKDAFNALGRVINTRRRLQQKNPNDSDANDLLSSGVIQHFELAYETCWKFLKEFLEIKHDVKVNSPKAAFRECYELRILPKVLVDELTRLTDIRNETTHTYSQDKAQEVCDDILKHYLAQGNVLEVVNIH